MRLVACSRSTSQTISLATIGSYIGEISPPAPTPESTRTPGPLGSTYSPIEPGAGAKFFEASSALMRHSIAWPRRTTSSCLIDSSSPAAARMPSLTMSMPVVISVTQCSTWTRVFISRKKYSGLPSRSESRPSIVPAPT